MAGIWNNIYNSVLSGPGTIVKAAVGNIGGIMAKPVTHFPGVGGLVGKDWKAFQRNWIAYSSVAESFPVQCHMLVMYLGKHLRTLAL